MPFNPCGMIMDLVRACYTTKMQIFTNSGFGFPVRWFFTAPGAQCFPDWHRFGSGNWAAIKGNWKGPGEISGEPRPFIDGTMPTYIPLDCFTFGLFLPARVFVEIAQVIDPATPPFGLPGQRFSFVRHNPLFHIWEGPVFPPTGPGGIGLRWDMECLFDRWCLRSNFTEWLPWFAPAGVQPSFDGQRFAGDVEDFQGQARVGDPRLITTPSGHCFQCGEYLVLQNPFPFEGLMNGNFAGEKWLLRFRVN